METTKQRPERFQYTRNQIKEFILQGKVYVLVNSISKGGTIRKMSFYVVDCGKIQHITQQIAFMYNGLELDYYDDELKVKWCGMDMCFHVLYIVLWYEDAKNWDQNYWRL